MSGDRTKLAAVGLVADDLTQANEIQMEAFRQLGTADKAIDLADATARLA